MKRFSFLLLCIAIGMCSFVVLDVWHFENLKPINKLQTLWEEDIANMREVMNLLRNNDPTVARYQHDWALLSLLSNHTNDWDEPKIIMHDLYIQDPSNPNNATGYAFALAQVAHLVAQVEKSDQAEERRQRERRCGIDFAAEVTPNYVHRRHRNR